MCRRCGCSAGTSLGSELPIGPPRRSAGAPQPRGPGHPAASAWPLILLAALVVLGLAAHMLDLVDLHTALDWARGHAAQWWFAPLLVVLQVLLFTFALPGSTVLWLAAPLLAPTVATTILVVGGLVGALAAYAFARRLTGASLQRLQASRGYRILERESDFLLLCALRLVPAFPHSVINYAAGTLRLPLLPFAASTAIGFAVKVWLYANVIHNALAAERLADLASPQVLWPLIVLAAAMLLARAVLRGRRRGT